MTDARGFIDVAHAVADACPDRPALIIGDEVTTYRALREAIDQAAGCLAAHGCGPGARVALADDCTVAAVGTAVAAGRIGGAACLMNPRLTAEEMAALLVAADCGDVGVAGRGAAAALVAAGCGDVLEGDAVLRGGETPERDAGDPDPDAACTVLFTSGTTGTPKAIPLAHRMLSLRIAAFSAIFDPESPPVVALMCVPFVHIGGMLGLLVALARGHTTVVQQRFDAGEWLGLTERHRVNTCFLVPTMLHRILEHPAFGDADLSSLQALTYGAAPAPPTLVRRAMEVLPHVAFANVFGQTETLGSITALTPEDHRTEKMASVGRPLPGVDVRVVDPGSGADLPRGSIGELWVKTEASVIGEARDDGPVAPPGWLRTGDLASQDEDGYLYPAGRLSETINRGGEKFAPLEIEAVLRTHPLVRDVAVAGVADPEMGSRVGVAVVASGPLTLEELRSHCDGRLATFKMPERLILLEAIPYNDFGKVARRRLSEVIEAAN